MSHYPSKTSQKANLPSIEETNPILGRFMHSVSSTSEHFTVTKESLPPCQIGRFVVLLSQRRNRNKKRLCHTPTHSGRLWLMGIKTPVVLSPGAAV